MSIGRAAFLLVASILAGAINSVAGGGTLLSFPAAIAAGLPPIVANATNAVALVPGSLAAAWSYRRQLAGLEGLVALLVIPAIVGATIGATILRHTPQRLFDGVVPWLVLGATLLILLQGLFKNSRSPGDGPNTVPPAPRGPGGLAVILICQLGVSIYGGYFGAAMGILMLAFLGHLPARGPNARLDLHQMNAVKNVLAVAINGAASIDFIAHGLVSPAPALVMAAGAIAGGVVGGHLGRRARPRQVRRIVVAIGFAMAALLAWRRYV
jgi:uncharacterized membrane protein YfcA